LSARPGYTQEVDTRFCGKGNWVLPMGGVGIGLMSELISPPPMPVDASAVLTAPPVPPVVFVPAPPPVPVPEAPPPPPVGPPPASSIPGSAFPSPPAAHPVIPAPQSQRLEASQAKAIFMRSLLEEFPHSA